MAPQHKCSDDYWRASIARATQHDEKAGKSHFHVPSCHHYHKNVFSIMTVKKTRQTRLRVI